MSNKAANNMSSSVEQPTINLSPNMPNDPVVQSNKDLALNEQQMELAVEDQVPTIQQAMTPLVAVGTSWDVHAVTGRYLSTDFVLSDAKVSRKTSVTGGGFVRYPFELQDLGNIELTNNKYLIGFHAVSISITLDIFLSIKQTPVNAGDTVGGLGDTLVEKKTKNLGLYPVVLTAMNVKQYNNKIYLSSSSSSQILDDPHIPALKEFKKGISDGEGALAHVTVNVDHSQPKDGTLENLLIWARNRKNDSSTFNCKVRIDNVRTKKGWNYPSCGGSKCKKGIERKAGSFWCDSCNKPVEYPVLRIELDISDQTASTVTVDVHAILSRALQNVIGTTHILELKSHTYYEHDTFESFTFYRIIPEEAMEEMLSLAMIDGKRLIPIPLCDWVELEDSEEEIASAWNGAQENAKDGSGFEKKKKRRYIVYESDSE
ncbi:DNA helicase PIF1, ATP-dependent [Tanacetum coccineum]